MMWDFVFGLFLTLLVKAAVADDKCKLSAVFTYGKCPGTCDVLSPADFVKKGLECAGLQQFGCEWTACGVPNPFSAFTCKLNVLKVEDKICAGDKVVFDGINITERQQVSYFIDLNALPLSTDLCLLSDATGSMADAIGAAKDKFLKLVGVFKDTPDVKFGVGYYRDESELGGDGFENSQPLTSHVAAARRAVDNLIAVGGGDGPEANLVALYKIATDPSIGWRKESRKIVVYFGDWPGHEPTCVTGLPQLTRSVVSAALQAKNITVVAVSFISSRNPGLDKGAASAPITSYKCAAVTAAGPGQATAIVRATKGAIVEEKDQTKLIETIEKALNSVPKTFDVDDSECSAGLLSVHDPTLPLTVLAGSSTTVKHTIELKPSVCRSPAKFQCRYRYTESGAGLPLTTIEFVNIRGCP